MDREAIISATLARYRLAEHNAIWARRVIDMPLGELRSMRGDLVDFSGSGDVLSAVIEAREAIARAALLTATRAR